MDILVISGTVNAKHVDRLSELLGEGHGLRWLMVPKKKSKKLVAAASVSIRAGTYTHVVWVTKWSSHNNYEIIREATQAASVRLITQRSYNPSIIYDALTK